MAAMTKRFAAAGMGLTLVLASPAPAQGTSDSAPPALFSDLTRCRTITDDAARLTCFDAAATRLSDAADKREIVVLDQAEVRKTRRSLFGFNLPKLPFFGNNRDDRPEEPEFQEINSTVKSIRGLGYGKYSIAIAEGAVWQTTEPLRGSPSVGDSITIKKGLIGAYFLSVDGKRASKAMRVN